MDIIRLEPFCNVLLDSLYVELVKYIAETISWPAMNNLQFLCFINLHSFAQHLNGKSPTAQLTWHLSENKLFCIDRLLFRDLFGIF